MFGGTSGAAPMVSGSAALLIQAYPARTPAEIKAVLMNTAETDIMNNAGVLRRRPGPDHAASAAARSGSTRPWGRRRRPGSAHGASAALSFGFVDVSGITKITKKVTSHNYSDRAITYTIDQDFRFADDEASGAVTIKAPARIKVPAHGTRTFRVDHHDRRQPAAGELHELGRQRGQPGGPDH